MSRSVAWMLLSLPGLACAGPVEVIAHRGASYAAPDNTVASFEEAWRQKSDAAELDTYLTKDGKLIVKDPKVAKRMADLGVDGITTDRPAWLRERLEPKK